MTIDKMNFEEKKGLCFSNDDEEIIYYLVDNLGKDVLKSFDQNEHNTGIAIFFEDKSNFKDLVVIMRHKYFAKSEENGLVMFLVRNLYKNPEAKIGLIEIVTKSIDNKELRYAVIDQIDKHSSKSIQANA